jgi:hypothetical protein
VGLNAVQNLSQPAVRLNPLLKPPIVLIPFLHFRTKGIHPLPFHPLPQNDLPIQLVPLFYVKFIMWTYRRLKELALSTIVKATVHSPLPLTFF